MTSFARQNRAFFVMLFCFVGNLSFGQQFGGHPATTLWQEIDTDTVRVIFQPGLEKQAKRIVAIEHRLMSIQKIELGNKFKKIDIVVQNKTMQSNGYVGLPPFRSEFYATAPQNPYQLGTLPFLDMLALHEYRHVLQDINSKKGWNKLLFFIAGQNGWALGSSLTVPNWFSEGDAVMNETRFSPQGRGRLPSFYNGYRALFLENVSYSYTKTRNGSFKDFVPDHYKFGYLMSLYASENFGNDIWGKVLQNNFSRLPLYPFSRGLKKYTGLNTKSLYNETLKDFNEKNRNELPLLGKDPSAIKNSLRKKTFLEYKYPSFTNDDEIVALKFGYSQIPTIVRINKQLEEEVLCLQGYTYNDYISYNNGIIAWTENNYHPRWGWRDYSDILLFEIQNKTKKRVATKTKMVSPHVSFAGNKIVAVELNETDITNLVILDTAGNKLLRWENPHHFYISYPKWDSTDRSIYFSARDIKGNVGILQLKLLENKIDTVLPFSQQPIGQFSYYKRYLIYTAAYQGFDNIYAYNTTTKKYFRITRSLIGNYDPSAYSDKLLYTRFSSKGNNILEKHLDEAEWEETAALPLSAVPQYRSPVFEEEETTLLSSVDTADYPIKKYKQWKHLLYFHSWGIRTDHPYYGINISSENILNNAVIELGTGTNVNEGTWQHSASITYGGFYPVWTASTTNANRSYYTFRYQRHTSFIENIVQLRASLPFNLTKGIYSRFFTPSIHVSYSMLQGHDLKTKDVLSQHVSMSFINIRRKAYKHLFSRLGQYIQTGFSNSFSLDNTYRWFINTEFSLPGIGTNHAILFQVDVAGNGSSWYRYQDNFIYPRGYGRMLHDRIVKTGINYHSPLLYPDFGIAGLVYFKRIRTNLFYDWCQSSYEIPQEGTYANAFPSVGAELIFDLHFFNTSPLYSIYIRYSYLLNEAFRSRTRTDYGFWEIGVPIVRIP